MRPLFELEKTAINVDWNVLKIKRVLDTPITDGPHETPELLDEGIPFLSAESVKKGKIDFNLKRGYISREDHEKYIKKCKPQRDDIFMIKSGATTGNVAMVETDEEFSIWSPLALIRADKEIIQPKYLYYFIGSAAFREQVEISWSFGTQQNIGMKVIENLFISIPPLHLQEKLVHYIEKKVVQIDKLIEMKELNIKLLEQQRQSIITEAVTKGLNPNVKMKDSGVEWIGEIPEHWSILALKHIASEKKHSFVDGPFGSDLKNEEYVDSGVPVIQLNNIKNGDLRVINMNFVTKKKSEQLKRHIAYPGDLVIAKMASPIARSAVVPKTYENYVIVADCIKLKLKENYLNHYINFAMNTPFTIAQAESFANGTTRSRVNLSIIKNLKLPIPNFEEQKEIASYLTLKVSEVNNVIKAVENQIQKLKEYRQALIYEAVTGKIDVRDMELDEVR
ncbi:restriction endonuclease subunit S [Bacillus altitudinis]|uniref:restriction endonuclease subunit S n=1 Tax=Bacillus altitudinis TaxID=293387 RepID=UPI003982AE85